MEFSGHCYCDNIQYHASGDPVLQLQCHFRGCQYLSGRATNNTIGMPETGFSYTKDSPKHWARNDLSNPVTREFCPQCGTQTLTRALHALPNVMLIKVGTMDDPKTFSPDLTTFTRDMQPFHHIAEGKPAFEGMPG